MSDAAPIERALDDRGVLRVTLARPQKRNALSHAVLAALDGLIHEIQGDREVRVVVLGAEGPAFCAGHDLGEMAGDVDEQEYHSLFHACTRVMLGLRRLPQPVIARVHGMATAAGCQLVAACDLAVAAETARFATPGVRIGLFCTTPMVPLVRAVQPKAAFEMLATGNAIDAERALRIGLVNRVVPEDELDAAVDELCAPILAASPQVLALGKRAFYDQLSLPEDAAYERAIGVMTANAVTPAAQEGMAAFLQKRPPVWPA